VRLKLAAAGYEAELAPGIGGAVLALRWCGRDILRPTPVPPPSVDATANFPLIPYANRIAGGHFDWDGKTIDLPILADFAPHALHGNGWLMGWDVLGQSDTSAAFGLTRSAEDWPSSWRGDQSFALTEAGLTQVLSVTNTGDHPMPAGLGFHPCFQLGGAPSVDFDAGQVWLVDDTQIPDRLSKPEVIACFKGGRSVRDADRIDHCYAGWSGVAMIDTLAGRARLEASANARHLHVYTPPGGASVCLEPVTHRPDAVHGQVGEMPVLAPGETEVLTIRIGLDVSARPG